MKKNHSICVVGLGYVGLPLTIELARHFKVTGYDISKKRVESIKLKIDPNGEVSTKDFEGVNVLWTHELSEIVDNNIYIVTVPTPVDSKKNPDLSHIINASEAIGNILKAGDLIIYESTVYPGCTEGICMQTLEKVSGLKHGVDFFLGYSPERINPADKTNSITTIKKIVSGCCEKSTNLVESIYSKIIDAGVHRASSIKVAEAAKVTENIQRDVNIALMNELSTIFNVLEIDTYDVLAAASTKWNFIPFKPGLVGGHCIGVDPYYLISKAKNEGVDTPVLSSARYVNEHVVDRVIQKVRENFKNRTPKVLLMGLTFKENCSDTRNSKSIELGKRLQDFCSVHAIDPFVDSDSLNGLDIVNGFSDAPYDCIIISVMHRTFKNIDPDYLKSILCEDGLIFDLLNGFPDIKDYSF